MEYLMIIFSVHGYTNIGRQKKNQYWLLDKSSVPLVQLFLKTDSVSDSTSEKTVSLKKLFSKTASTVVPMKNEWISHEKLCFIVLLDSSTNLRNVS
jgi:hypothetical protein